MSLAAKIASAQMTHGSVDRGAIPELIHSIYNTLEDVGSATPTQRVPPAPPHDHDGYDPHRHHDHGAQKTRPVYNVYVHPTYGITVFDDRLICMEDGLSMKMLKRHLLKVHGMTPEEYRAKWDLPVDYPMVAPVYAQLRSSLALQNGLGRKPAARPSRQRRTG